MRKVKEAKGEDMAYKFKKDKREEIIEAYKSGMKVNDIIKTQKQIAKEFSVSVSLVQKIHQNKIWTWL